MNLLLLQPEDFLAADNQSPDHVARIEGRRFKHLKKIIKVSEGQKIVVGLLNGDLGTGTVQNIEKNALTLTVQLDRYPPSPLPITLIMALPRPLMLKRILQSISSFGIKNIYFIHSKKVEKSFWQSSDLGADVIRQQCILGLEQSKDTILPEVVFKQSFSDFVEKDLPCIIKNKQALLADIGDYPACPSNITDELVLIIGPEGGFTVDENQRLIEQGLLPVQLGRRVLRVETAVSALIGRLMPV